MSGTQSEEPRPITKSPISTEAKGANLSPYTFEEASRIARLHVKSAEKSYPNYIVESDIIDAASACVTLGKTYYNCRQASREAMAELRTLKGLTTVVTDENQLPVPPEGKKYVRVSTTIGGPIFLYDYSLMSPEQEVRYRELKGKVAEIWQDYNFQKNLLEEKRPLKLDPSRILEDLSDQKEGISDQIKETGQAPQIRSAYPNSVPATQIVSSMTTGGNGRCCPS